MNGFIVYPTFRVIDGKAYVKLYGKLENGESFLTINEFKPYFFIKKTDVEKTKNVGVIQSERFGNITYEIEDSNFKNFNDDILSKVITSIPGTVAEIRNEFQKSEITTYEADIRFVYRFLIDNDIRGSMKIDGDYEKGEYVDRVYTEPKLSSSEFFPKLKTLAFDIETNMKAEEIFSISMYTDDYEDVLIVSDKKLKNATSFPDEKSMLIAFKKKIHEIDPDIITGWNVIDFDFNVIEKAFRKHKIDFVIGRDQDKGRIRLNSSFFKDSTANIVGRQILDGITLLKISFISFEDYKLNTAAHHILGDEKDDIFGTNDKGAEIERIFKEEPQKLADYNLKDSKLVYDILEKKKLIQLTIQRSLLTGMQLDRVKGSIASLDNLYIRETKKLGYVCNNSSFSDREERIKGGFVQDSIPGIYDYINVLDFKSLYPSIIRTFNIDPISFAKAKGKDVIIAPNDAKFSKVEGILPGIIQELWKQRDDAKKRENMEESFAVKITMNSFFGVMANPMCRFYSLDMANAITSFARYIIQETARLIEKKGFKVIYCDTDSTFVVSNAKDSKEAKKNGEMISIYVNKHWAKYAKEKSDRKSYLELQFEKTFVRFLMPYGRGSTSGAKKRYAGTIIKDGKEEIKFKGLEFVRRDWTAVSKKFQLELLDRIFHKKEVVGYVKKFVDEIKNSKY